MIGGNKLSSILDVHFVPTPNSCDDVFHKLDLMVKNEKQQLTFTAPPFEETEKSLFTLGEMILLLLTVRVSMLTILFDLCGAYFCLIHVTHHIPLPPP
jgi:hypothetical protein